VCSTAVAKRGGHSNSIRIINRGEGERQVALQRKGERERERTNERSRLLAATNCRGSRDYSRQSAPGWKSAISERLPERVPVSYLLRWNSRSARSDMYLHVSRFNITAYILIPPREGVASLAPLARRVPREVLEPVSPTMVNFNLGFSRFSSSLSRTAKGKRPVYFRYASITRAARALVVLLFSFGKWKYFKLNTLHEVLRRVVWT